MDPEDASRFFYVDGFLLSFGNNRTYSAERLSQGVNSLVQHLQSLGYYNATAEASEPAIDTSSGDVRAVVTVDAGEKHRIVSIKEHLADGVDLRDAAERLVEERAVDVLFTTREVQDAVSELRNRFYEAGYPDASIEAQGEPVGKGPEGDVLMQLDLRLSPGERARLAAIDIRGNTTSSDRFLRKKIALDTGSWLDRRQIEDARFRLGRLGIYSRVDTQIEPDPSPQARTAVFYLEEGTRKEMSLLVGWGSYEMLRVGVSARHYNLWGRAHKIRFQALQSFKSTEVELGYQIPEFLNSPASLDSTARFLQREEVSFERREWHIDVGLNARAPAIDSTFRLAYRLQVLESLDIQAEVEAPERSRAGAVVLTHRYDNRDAVVSPLEGLMARNELEVASVAFGSEVEYQRLESLLAFHEDLGGALFFHAALRHGALFSLGSDRSELPLNKRFFPGGENSIRGYPEGEAAPLDASGTPLGAEVYSLLTFELEASISPSFRVVIFSDNLYQSEDAGDYPGADNLHSIGLGLRYSTPLGPLRLEYGYNLNPRPSDPSGTLHFSLGNPF